MGRVTHWSTGEGVTEHTAACGGTRHAQPFSWMVAGVFSASPTHVGSSSPLCFLWGEPMQPLAPLL